MTSYSDRAQLDQFWRYVASKVISGNGFFYVGGIEWRPEYERWHPEPDYLARVIEKIAEMQIKGVFWISFIDTGRPRKYWVELEKFVVRKTFWGDKVGYRARVTYEDHTVESEAAYLVGRGLSDVSARAIALIGQGVEPPYLNREQSELALSRL